METCRHPKAHIKKPHARCQRCDELSMPSRNSWGYVCCKCFNLVPYDNVRPRPGYHWQTHAPSNIETWAGVEGRILHRAMGGRR